MVRSSRPTISETKDCRAGASKAEPMPNSERQHVDHPHLGVAGDRDGAQQQRGDRHRPAWVSWSSARFGNRSATTPAYGASRSTGRNCRPVVMPSSVPPVPGQAEHQPVLGHALHPGAGVRHDAPGEVQPVVGVAQGAEGGAHESLFSLLGQVVARIGAAARSTSRSSAVRSRSWRASHSSRRRAVGQRPGRGPGRSGSTTTTRPSVSCGVARDVAALLEEVDLAGHARRLHPLEGGQLADGQVAVPEQRARAPPSIAMLRSLSGSRSLASRAAQPHHGHAELRRQPGVGAGDLLHGGHVLSLTHYPC